MPESGKEGESDEGAEDSDEGSADESPASETDEAAGEEGTSESDDAAGAGIEQRLLDDFYIIQRYIKADFIHTALVGIHCSDSG